MVYRGEFDPYGNLVYEWGTAGLNTRKFTGYERDSNTGLDYANARMYGPGRGRFIQPDPAKLLAADPQEPQSLNLYSYTGNDPVNYIDPTGLETCRYPGSFLCQTTYAPFWYGFGMGGGGVGMGGGSGGGADWTSFTKDGFTKDPTGRSGGGEPQSSASQQVKETVERLNNNCKEIMFGSNFQKALDALVTGKHRSLKVINLNDPNVASDPQNRKYIDYFNKTTQSTDAVTYKQEAIILGKDFDKGI
ncbi:MAG: RHS repeat-associated core domain-containing protein [Acidobacteria bacterium]|nr:RHS repeat-associated core domain-containing protein [Acidobacteriota bacterium]